MNRPDFRVADDGEMEQGSGVSDGPMGEEGKVLEWVKIRNGGEWNPSVDLSQDGLSDLLGDFAIPKRF